MQTQGIIEELKGLLDATEKVLMLLAKSEKGTMRALRELSAYDLIVFEQGLLPLQLAALASNLELNTRPQYELDDAYAKIGAEVEARRDAYAG